MVAIKFFEFTDFFDVGWRKWKEDNLLQAMLLAENALQFAGGGAVHPVPILPDEEDYKFLCQFPPTLWTQALEWRYNEGLLAAARIRDLNTEHNYDPETGIIHYKDVPNQTVTLRFNTKGGGVKGQSNVWAFPNINIGIRDLMKKLEAPAKYYKDHKPPGVHPTSLGLNQINPYEYRPDHVPTDPMGKPYPEGSPEWEAYKHHYRGRYLAGKHDTDLMNALEIPPNYWDMIPNHLLPLPKGAPKEPSQEYFAKRRKELKDAAQHSFEGMPVMQSSIAKKVMRKWVQAQALGFLGDTENIIRDPSTGEIKEVGEAKINDPLTGEVKDLGLADPKKLYGGWKSKIGKEEDGGQVFDLKVPTITREITYQPLQADGETPRGELVKNKKYEMPYLLAGVLVPQLVGDNRLDVEQKYRIINRRLSERKPPTSLHDLCGDNKPDLREPWKEFLEKCPAAKGTILGSFEELLANWDLLKPEQREFLLNPKNHRDLLHLLHHQNVERRDEKGKLIIDPYVAKYYAIGWDANNEKRKIANMPRKVLKEVIAKYKNALEIKANVDIDNFIESARINSKADEKGHRPYKGALPDIPEAVLDVLSGLSKDLAKIAATMLCLNLGSMKYGIYDKDINLTSTPPDYNTTEVTSHEKEVSQEEIEAEHEGTQHIHWGNSLHTMKKKNHPEYEQVIKLDTQNQLNRTYWTWNFVRDLSQAAIGGLPSRRKRGNMNTISLNTAGGKDEDGQQKALDVEKTNISSTNAPERTHNTDEEGTRRAQHLPDTEQIARVSWHVPTINQDIDKYFNVYRNIIKKKLGDGEEVSEVEQADRKLKMEMAVIAKLYNAAAIEAMQQQLPYKDVVRAGQEAVKKGLADELRRMGYIDPENAKANLPEHIPLPSGLKNAQQDAMFDFIETLDEEDDAYLPRLTQVKGKDGKLVWTIKAAEYVNGEEMKPINKWELVTQFMHHEKNFWDWWKGAWINDEKGCQDLSQDLLDAMFKGTSYYKTIEPKFQELVDAAFAKKAQEPEKPPEMPRPSYNTSDPTEKFTFRLPGDQILPQTNIGILGKLPFGWRGLITRHEWMAQPQNRRKLHEYLANARSQRVLSDAEKEAFADIQTALSAVEKIPDDVRDNVDNPEWIKANYKKAADYYVKRRETPVSPEEKLFLDKLKTALLEVE